MFIPWLIRIRAMRGEVNTFASSVLTSNSASRGKIQVARMFPVIDQHQKATGNHNQWEILSTLQPHFRSPSLSSIPAVRIKMDAYYLALISQARLYIHRV